jgi:hypothetical protein
MSSLSTPSISFSPYIRPLPPQVGIEALAPHLLQLPHEPAVWAARLRLTRLILRRRPAEAHKASSL